MRSRSSLGLLIRWSGRDFRQRWVQVGALSLVIALAVGAWAGLGGTDRWRRESNDRSFAALNMHDLRVELTPGSFAREGELAAVLSSIEHAEWIEAFEERLLLPTQVDATTNAEAILAPGEILGVGNDGEPEIDAIEIRSGSAMSQAAGVLLDVHFATQNELPPTGQIRLSGDVTLPYVGHGLSPEYFVVVSDRGGLFAASSYAVVFAPLPMLQELSGHSSEVNQLVLTSTVEADPDVLADEVRGAIGAALPGVGFTLTPVTEEISFRLLYDDIDNDQRFYNIFAGLIFAGATFGAFNLARRLVESQRRELGISMALGVPSPIIALRPLLVGLQMSVLGAVFGVGVGLALAEAMKSLFESLLPLPVWETSMNWGAFIRAALVGVLVPLCGVAWPVFRALRVTPNETMMPPYRSQSHRRIPRIGRTLRLPGSSLARVPLRNVLRSLQRTTLTVLALAASIAALVAVLGMLDSFTATIDQGEASSLLGNPTRITVDLEQVEPVDSDVVRQVTANESVDEWSLGLRLPASLTVEGAAEIDIALEVRPLAAGLWTPALDREILPSQEPELILSRKAMDDLGLEVGQTVTLRHPVRQGPLAFGLTETSLRIAAIHDLPLRSSAFIDSEHAGLFGLRGMTNSIDVVPVPSASRDDVKRALFPIGGVAAVQGVAETAEIFRELLDDFLSFLLIVEGATVALALLVAFNATSINVDERQREHATMRAFGLPLPKIVGLMIAENAILGLLGGLAGVGVGALLVRWIVEVSVADTVPDIGITATVSGQSVLVALALGVVTVALTPLLSIYRLRRTDLPSTLRVVE
ncbi:MAG: ABC transporter permease [Acidimicrobiales bacterium]|nr:ABC transporter permease [Acidimicrobiales bacterium]